MVFETIQSEVSFQGRVFGVRRDQERLPSGQLADLDVVTHNGAVALVPFDENGNIWFVRQYRYPAQHFLLELPAGTLKEGEDPEACGLRELREEIGMSADHLQKIGTFFLAPGYSTEYTHLYLATKLYLDPLPGDIDKFMDISS